MRGTWATRYRPTELHQFVGQEALAKEVSSILDSDAPMQHYLFHSVEPGTGKTTLAEIIAHGLGYQLHKYNASSKKQRGIEFVEEELAPLSRLGQYETIFFLDEADQLTSAAQSALKGIIEDAQGFFILTCNDLSKVSPWLQSRCQVRTFAPIGEEHMFERLNHINIQEQANVTNEQVQRIIAAHRGDLRNAIGALQAVASMPDNQRESFTLSLGAPLVNAERVLRLCFKEKAVDEAVKAMGSPVNLKEAINVVFRYGVESPARNESKLLLVDAATQAQRDLLSGVEAHYVVWDFCRRLAT
jgi:DNA polymerase III delta prime subunit